MKNIFPTRLRVLRDDYSQSEFSQKIGAKQTTYSSWERGVKEPSLDMVLQISLQMGVTTDWLLGLSDSRTGTCAPVADAAITERIKELELDLAKANAKIEGLEFALNALKR